jgi:hypothetical protein
VAAEGCRQRESNPTRRVRQVVRRSHAPAPPLCRARFDTLCCTIGLARGPRWPRVWRIGQRRALPSHASPSPPRLAPRLGRGGVRRASLSPKRGIGQDTLEFCTFTHFFFLWQAAKVPPRLSRRHRLSRERRASRQKSGHFAAAVCSNTAAAISSETHC